MRRRTVSAAGRETETERCLIELRDYCQKTTIFLPIVRVMRLAKNELFLPLLDVISKTTKVNLTKMQHPPRTLTISEHAMPL